MQLKSRFVAAVALAVFVSASVFSAGCAANDGAAPTATPEATAEATPASEPTPTPSPEPAPTLSDEQKKMMVWMGEDYSGYAPTTIILFYAETNGEGRLIWAIKEPNATQGVFDFYEAFNHQLLFQVTVPMDDQLKANPNTYTKYISQLGKSFSNYTFIASGKLFDIDQVYLENSLYFYEISAPCMTLYSYIDEESYGVYPWTKEKMLEAYIGVTPTQYLLPFWEYVPGAVKPASFDNPPSPTPTATPMPSLSREQTIELLGIDDDFEAGYLFGQISVYYYLLNGSKRIIWAVDYYGTPNGTTDVHSLFNGEYLFSYYIDQETAPANLPCMDVWKYYSACSPMLEGVHLLGSGTLADLIVNYRDWEIPYNGNELLDKVQNDSWYDWDAYYADMEVPLLKDELIDLYLELTPPEYIPPFWEYVPGAVTPDALFTPAP
ncbi:MAG: hypothetical protein ABFC73_07080 [Clostridiaceae bacterium]